MCVCVCVCVPLLIEVDSSVNTLQIIQWYWLPWLSRLNFATILITARDTARCKNDTVKRFATAVLEKREAREVRDQLRVVGPVVKYLLLWAQQTTKVASGLQTNLFPFSSYSAQKSPNHQIHWNLQNWSRNKYETKHTCSNNKHKLFEEMVPSTLTLVKGAQG